MVISWLPWDKLSNTLAEQEEVANWAGAAIIVPALAFSLLWMYARRRARPARLAAAAACTVVPLAMLFAHAPLVRWIGYPQARRATPLRVAIDVGGAGGKREFTRTDSLYDQGNPLITIPVEIGSTDPDTAIAIDGFRVTLTGDNGWRWQSEWVNSSMRMSNETYQIGESFNMPASLADRLESVHAKATIEFAFGTYRLGRQQTIDTSPERFKVEGAGYCDWKRQVLGQTRMDGPNCVAPLRTATVMVSQIQSRDYTCKEDGEPPLPAGYHTTSPDYGTEGVPAEFDPSPLHGFGFGFGGWTPPVRSVRSPKDFRTVSLCRGTPLLVRTGVFVDRMRATFDLGPIGAQAKPKVDDQTKETAVHFDPKAE
jgi:hypothetical protein